MSMIDRSLDGMASFSGQLGAILRRRLREVGGIALISLAMMAALALATWSVQDPSLSHATDAPVHNLLGMPGAIAADLMMQLLGLGSLALLLPIAVWGYRLLGHRRLSHERLRVLLWLIGAVLTAAFASCLPRTRIGRCRRAWAASSATPCCGCRSCCCIRRLSAQIASSRRSCSGSRAARYLRPAPPVRCGATRRRKTRPRKNNRPRTTKTKTTAAGSRSASWRIRS